jgi:hypothetical protein
VSPVKYEMGFYIAEDDILLYTSLLMGDISREDDIILSQI